MQKSWAADDGMLGDQFHPNAGPGWVMSGAQTMARAIGSVLVRGELEFSASAGEYVLKPRLSHTVPLRHLRELATPFGREP